MSSEHGHATYQMGEIRIDFDEDGDSYRVTLDTGQTLDVTADELARYYDFTDPRTWVHKDTDETETKMDETEGFRNNLTGTVPMQVTIYVDPVGLTLYDHLGHVVGVAARYDFEEAWGMPAPEPRFDDPLELGYTRQEVVALIKDRWAHNSESALGRVARRYCEILGDDFR